MPSTPRPAPGAPSRPPVTPSAPLAQTALITGGAGGLGQAIARRLAAAGHPIALWDIDAARVQAVAQHLTAQLGAGGPAIAGWAVDVTDARAVEAGVARVVERLGPLQVLVTCAGHNGPLSCVADYPLDGWRFVMQLNLDAVFYCCRAVVPHLLESGCGRIVNLSSIAGKEGNPQASAYSAAKAGVIALTKSLGKELAHTPIRVNCVTPAAIETDILQQVSPQFLDYVTAKIPLGRLGQADEVAALVAWLASPECSFSTGAVFDVSGGRATY